MEPVQAADEEVVGAVLAGGNGGELTGLANVDAEVVGDLLGDGLAAGCDEAALRAIDDGDRATGLDRRRFLAGCADGEIFEGPSLLIAAEITGGEGEAESVVRTRLDRRCQPWPG